MNTGAGKMSMTDKDLDLIEKASRIRLNFNYIQTLINEADTQEAKDILAKLEERAFIRNEQSYGEDY